MKKPVELVEVIITRQPWGTLYRGPIMAARGQKAVGVILGPVEAEAGDRVAILSEGRQPQIWELEKGFTVPKGRAGTPPKGIRFDFSLDVEDLWSVSRSEKMYSSQTTDYLNALNDPSVRVLL